MNWIYDRRWQHWYCGIYGVHAYVEIDGLTRFQARRFYPEDKSPSVHLSPYVPTLELAQDTCRRDLAEAPEEIIHMHSEYLLKYDKEMKSYITSHGEVDTSTYPTELLETDPVRILRESLK